MKVAVGVLALVVIGARPRRRALLSVAVVPVTLPGLAALGGPVGTGARASLALPPLIRPLSLPLPLPCPCPWPWPCPWPCP
ncbi:hypothetical protein O1M54_09840 [Streptomyces diastatochromogenes]|nr:hypothetical protein [Streptomyces diastatochromogenes]